MKVKKEQKTEILASFSEEEAALLREFLGKLSGDQILGFFGDRERGIEANRVIDSLYANLKAEEI